MKFRKIVLSMLLLAVSAVIVIMLGCAQTQTRYDPSARRRSPVEAPQPAQVETRVHDIRDLITQTPDFDNAPDLSGGSIQKPGQQQALDGAVAPGEELWVIEKPQRAAPGTQPAQAERQPSEGPLELPRSGALLAKVPSRAEPVAVPLKHTDVQASIAGYIATVDVTQQYHNPYSEKIEAVYVFPLPSNAAVNEFLMTIGDRKIRGIIREREEAQKIYLHAKSQGHVASLLTQERPNIFTQSVANIEPGKAIDINIKYFHTLDYVDGWYEFVFPMVVGPRFNPPGYTDGIGAVARGQHGASGQRVEVQYDRGTGYQPVSREHGQVAHATRSGHDIALAINIDPGVQIEQIESRSHQIEVSNPEQGLAQVKLAASDTIPNKDFVLRYKVAGETVKTALMTHRDERSSSGGGYFTLMIIPPDSLRDLPRQPLEMVFTLDVSGSMNGQPIAQSRKAIEYALTHMRPDDTFQIVLFQSNTQVMSERPLPATPQNVQRALQYVQREMQGSGGTMMLEGIKQSLNFPGDESRLRFVSILTDGYIGNEVEILREVHHSRGNARIFSFGVGSAPNRFLLDGMARLGAGVVAYIGLNDPADRVMEDFFKRISHPALVDVSVDWGSMQVSDVFPQRVPDLFVGRPVILTGRFTGNGDTTIKVKGKVGGEVRELEIPVKLDEAGRSHKGIASVWARMKIAELADQSMWQNDSNSAAMIKQVALEHGLMSAYTAFVAVDSSTQTAGDHGTTIAVPVPVPAGVRYETTVPER